ncbi:MAG: chloride channel protein [Bacteriovoracaceae bacterium]|nr:chloride channel protein [Bacteriovoracaceae bacterium]
MKIPQLWKFPIFKKLIQNEITEERTYFVLTLLTGVSAAIVAVFLHKATYYLTDFFGTNKTFTFEAFLYAGAAIFISGFITTRIFPSTSGSGIPGVRVALAVYHGNITLGSTIAKLLTTVLSLSTGVSLGREGPTVTIAAGIGSFFGNFFSMSKKRVKALVAVGAAGGIAAGFNTPIAAVVFTLEEIVGDLNAKVLGSIIISSVTASITASALQGNHPMFSELAYSLKDPRELVFFILVGIACAFIGPLWMSSVLKTRAMSLKLFKGHKLTIMMITIFLIAGVSYIAPEALGSGHHTIEEALLSLILDWKTILWLFAMKFLITSLCYSSGISGGLFLPTLLMGAMVGSFIGSMAQDLFPNITSNAGAYALVGMGAYFAAVIRAPFTSIIMVFELTRDYNIMLPLMIANIISYSISSKLTSGSIYEKISEQDGIHLPTRDDNEVLETLLVEDAMIDQVFTLDAKDTVAAVVEKIKGKHFSGYPVLKNGNLIGMISINEIGQNFAKENKDIKIEEICTKRIVHIYQDQSLLVAFHKLKKFQISRLPVVSRLNDKRLIGIITAENIVSQFGYHIQDDDENEIEELTEKLQDNK